MIETSCGSTQKLSSVNLIDKYGRQETIEDSVIRSLQQNNDIVIALATENYAWARSTNYLIVAQHNDEWIGYNYFVNNMPLAKENGAIANFNINPAVVKKESCDSLLKYITDNEAWKIRGDSAGNFCPNNNKNCVINDAAISRLWIITKNKLINPAYYAPEFYEECCAGNSERKLFLQIAYKISTIVTIQAHSR